MAELDEEEAIKASGFQASHERNHGSNRVSSAEREADRAHLLLLTRLICYQYQMDV